MKDYEKQNYPTTQQSYLKNSMPAKDSILKATEDLREGITKIWNVCFGDGEEYINFCLKNNLDKFIVYLADGVPAAMLCVIPCSYEGKKGGYVYAVATLPEFRNRGFSRKILEFAHLDMKKSGYSFSVLVPAGEDLFRFYQKQGYETKFYCSKTEYEFSEEKESLSISKLDKEEYLRLKKSFTKPSHVLWSDEHLEFIWNENKFTGGEMVKFSKDSKTIGIASVNAIEEKLYLREVLCSEGFDDIVNSVLAHYKKDAVVRSEPTASSSEAFGMIKSLNDGEEFKDGYISLVLD